MRELWRHESAIRLDWRNKISKQLVTRYDNLVVDFFNVKHVFNIKMKHSNRRTMSMGMYLFMERLITSAEIHQCNIIVANNNTTRTCASCRHINEPLTLDMRMLNCKECGITIDRDDNAAINCYNQY